MKRPRVWCFDLDDTLMWNTVTYNRAYIAFIQFLTEIWWERILCIQSIGSYQQDIDVLLGSEINPHSGVPYGFSYRRFPESFVRTYRWLCEEGFGKYDEGVAEQCREIGMRAFEEANYRRLGFVPGGEELLNFLAKEKHPLVLVTKGDPWVQNKKIRALNLEHWFKREYIHIVEEKTPSLFLEEISVFPNIEPSDAVMVGNSPSDIMPALRAGMAGFYTPCPTWKGEKLEMDKLTKDQQRRMVKFKGISEIIPSYQTLKP